MKIIKRICAIVCVLALCSVCLPVPTSAASSTDETVNITVIIGETVAAYPAINTTNGTINMTDPEIIQADNFIEITSWSTTGTSKSLKAKCYVKGLKEGEAIIKPKGTITNQSSLVSTIISNTFYRVTVIGREFTVTFNANGGSVSQNSKTVEYETAYGTLPVPVKTGYDFVGWYTAADGGTKITESTMFEEQTDQTLYAHWELNQSESYTINDLSGDINEEGFYAEVSVTKNADRNNMDVIIVALFDDAGKIVDMTYMKSNLPAGATAIFGGSLAGKGTTIRAFVWDGLDSMQPLSSPLEK